MCTLLYVYDYQNLELMKNTLTDFRFLSIGHLFHISNTVEGLLDLDCSELNYSVIDITNAIKDASYYRVFIERYLLTLRENFDNVNFALHTDYLDSFKEMLPYYFNDKDFNYNFLTEKIGTDNKLQIKSPAEIFIYSNQATIKKLYEDGTAVSLSNFVEEWNGLTLKCSVVNIHRDISENGIKYIDLSSAIKTLKVRTDLTFFFEVLLHHITTSTKYCVESSLVTDALEMFPFVFGNVHNMADEVDMTETGIEESPRIDTDKICSISAQISERLQGHSDFKEDLKRNLLKFTFLSKITERKILSILLCGDSGLGKTEFAKIASNTMFPNEPLIKISFGNYSTEGVLNSLIGSPLGYIGSEEGGELINKIRKSKSKIILIDEFERATPSVFNFFYELLEDGKFTDRHGLEHDLKGYLIILTSNMSPKQYQKLIPDSLKSRFDMVYNFIDLPAEEKHTYIQNTSNNLIRRLEEVYGVLVDVETIKPQLNQLVNSKNLREIKRNIEDIVFNDFIERYLSN